MIMLLFVVYSMGPGQTTCMLHYSLWASSGLPHGIGPRVSGSQSATNSCRQRDRERERARESKIAQQSTPRACMAFTSCGSLRSTIVQTRSASFKWHHMRASRSLPDVLSRQTPDYVLARPNCCLAIIRKSFLDLSKIQQECTGVQRGENVSGACLHSLTRCTTSDLECLMFWHFHLTDSLR